MTVPTLAIQQLGGEAGLPLLVLGPSLGTSTILWETTAPLLAEHYRLLAWDLPGHGASPKATDGFTVAELADAVVAAVDDAVPGGEAFLYAGVSLGGAAGLELLLRHGHRVRAAAIVASGARLGEPQAWHERAVKVRAESTSSLIGPSAQRWFAPESLVAHPQLTGRLLHALQDADDQSYALCCEALAAYDVRDLLAEITAPVLALWGRHDVVAPEPRAAEIAAGVASGQKAVIEGAAHLPPAEQPEATVAALREFFDQSPRRSSPMTRPDGAGLTDAERWESGMAVRRAVLSDSHVNDAIAAITPFTADWQDFITRTAWGDVWSRPGLDRRARSVAVLSALIAHGHQEEFAMHVRAARRNGLTVEEIGEVILQSAIYSGVPAANTAFRIASTVFAETGQGYNPAEEHA